MEEKLNFTQSFKFKNAVKTVVIDIGGISIKLVSEEQQIFDFLIQRYRLFQSTKKVVSCSIELHISCGLNFKSPDANEDFFNRQNFSEEINFIYSNGYVGYLNNKSKTGKVIVSNELSETWIEHFLRFAYSWLALEKKCLFFHGAGIINNNQGYVFFGPANAGKTTVTEFSSQHFILGDDMIMLQKFDNSVRVFATPFNINMGDKKLTNTKGNIKGFYRLRQDNKNYLRKMKNSKAIAELMSGVPLAKNNFHGHQTVFYLCSEIAVAVPCYDLHFTHDDSFWSLINGDI